MEIAHNNSNNNNNTNRSAYLSPSKANYYATNQAPPTSNPAMPASHRKSNSILHIRENSLEELDALFDPSKRNTRAHLPPLSKRNIPSSFFKQPPHKLLRNLHHHHNRQYSSIDSSYSSSPYSLNKHLNHGVAHGNPNAANGSLNSPNSMGSASPGLLMNNNHLRSISEPVSMLPYPPPNAFMNGSQMGQHLSSAQQQQQQQAPLQQINQNIINNNNNSGQYTPSPFEWQAARTNDGRVYYIK